MPSSANLRAVVGLDEKTASIAEDLRTQLPDARERCFNSLQADQPLIESKSRSGRRDISRDPRDIRSWPQPLERQSRDFGPDWAMA